MLRAVGQAVAVFCLYAAVVCWFTWPLATHMTTHRATPFPGSEFDPLYSAWVLAWETHALAEPGVALADANIYHPEPGALFYGPAAFGALPYFAPVFLLTGNPALAQNLLFLGSLTLTASLLHWVLFTWTSMHAAALISGVAFLANRWLIWTFVPTTPHLSVLMYFPLVLFLSASAPLRNGRAVLLLVLVILQGAIDLAYAAPAVLAPLLCLGLLDILGPRFRARGVRLLLIAFIAAGALLALYFPYVSVAGRNPHLKAQTNWPFDPARSYFDIPWGLLNFMSPLAIPTLALALIAGAALVAALGGWRGGVTQRTAWRRAFLWLVVGVAISLPLHAKWRGELYALPHLALLYQWLPLGSAVRNPERLRVTALMGAAVLAGLAFAEIARHVGASRSLRQGRRPSKVLFAAAALTCLLMYLQYSTTIGQPPSYGPRFPSSYPLSPAPRADSPVLAALRSHGGPTLEVPIPWPKVTMPAVHATAMYRSIFHWQPLLNGYASFWPERFPELMRLAARLPDRDALSRLRRATGLAYILVRAREELPIDAALSRQRQQWLELAARRDRPDLQLVAADDDLLLFRVGEEPETETANDRS